MFILSDNIQTDFEYFKDKDCAFSKKITKEIWATEFAILDPDGNKITFRDK